MSSSRYGPALSWRSLVQLLGRFSQGETDGLLLAKSKRLSFRERPGISLSLTL